MRARLLLTVSRRAILSLCKAHKAYAHEITLGIQVELKRLKAVILFSLYHMYLSDSHCQTMAKVS